MRFATLPSLTSLRSVAKGVIRIISDLHYRDRGGLRQLSQLNPLLEGIDQLVLNGDTLEMRHVKSAPYLGEIREYFSNASIQMTYIAGNHDPEISTVMDVAFADHAVWVTHGDVFWDSAAPWSPHAAQLRRLVVEERARLKTTEGDGHLSDLFAAHRAANLRLGALYDPSRHALYFRLFRLARLLIPPTQPLKIILAWKGGAEIARKWALRHRPAARFVIFGHLHYPGIWRGTNNRPTIINTGSFEPPWGGLCVDLSTTTLSVRRIENRQGYFYPGRVLDAFPLAPEAT